MSINVISVNLFSDEIVDLLWLHGGDAREKYTTSARSYFCDWNNFLGSWIVIFFSKVILCHKDDKRAAVAKNDIERILDKVNTTLFPYYSYTLRQSSNFLPKYHDKYSAILSQCAQWILKKNNNFQVPETLQLSCRLTEICPQCTVVLH